MLHHMATILICYGGHFESKLAAKIQKSSDLGEIWFPSRLWYCELISIVWEPNQFFFKSPLFCFHGICGIVCSPDSDFFLAYLVPLDVDVVTNKFHQFLFDHFCVFQFFSILAVSMVTVAILKISKVVCTSTHSA
jgi:hypothetical protein